ncbi:MAG: ferritin family protein [Syntrophobacterales bacterium]|jgi:rubrerythrin
MSTKENLIKVYEYALNQEQTGMSFFQTSLERMGIGAAVSAFKRLVEEEKKHILFISRIIDNLKAGGDIDIANVQEFVLEPTNYFDERAKSEFLQQCVEGSMVPDVTVFNTAWLIEKDLSEFYGNAAKHTEGAASETFGMLSRWEKAHEKFFKEYRDKLSAVYAGMPWGG